jgi:hypothetical protein
VAGLKTFKVEKSDDAEVYDELLLTNFRLRKVKGTGIEGNEMVGKVSELLTT